MTDRMIKKIAIFGLGYIGLPTAALLSRNGYKVLGIDINSEVVNTINKGLVHIVEPGLEEAVKSAVSSGMLTASTTTKEADIFIISVPTPFTATQDVPEPNIDFVVSALKEIAKVVQNENIIILESTSPVGTLDILAETLKQEGVDLDTVHLAYCPERVLPGNIMAELISNDRIVGGLNEKASNVAAEFYKSFVKGKVVTTNAKTAEMCKLTENSFRDVNLAFANEISLICAKEGIDVWELISLANRHPRVNILQPGTGVGGHCIAVDPWFIVARDPVNAKLIRVAREVNDHKTEWVVQDIVKSICELEEEKGKKIRVGCFGLAFKPNVDDLRQSPSLKVANRLVELGHDVVFVEPNIKSHAEFELTAYGQAVKVCDLCVVLVKHDEFSDILNRIGEQKVKILDYCGLL